MFLIHGFFFFILLGLFVRADWLVALLSFFLPVRNHIPAVFDSAILIPGAISSGPLPNQ